MAILKSATCQVSPSFVYLVRVYVYIYSLQSIRSLTVKVQTSPREMNDVGAIEYQSGLINGFRQCTVLSLYTETNREASRDQHTQRIARIY